MQNIIKNSLQLQISNRDTINSLLIIGNDKEVVLNCYRASAVYAMEKHHPIFN